MLVEGNTLTVWSGNPENEYAVEKRSEEVIMMKDKEENVIGFEKLNYSLPKSTQLTAAFETGIV